MAKAQDEIDQIIADLRANTCHDLVILAIPSHDRDKKPIHDQDTWTEGAMELFSDLYGGATAYRAFKGIYRSDSGEDLWDNPIMVESLAEREKVESRQKLESLLHFIKRMKSGTRQEAVMLVINDCRRFV